MERQELLQLTETFLSAWNAQDVDRVLSCYTEDCVYQDPNTRGPVVGHSALRPYLTKLFEGWNMHWSMREFFQFADGDGGSFLWTAHLTPASGGKTAEINGMDLALVRADRLCRNEVYFDRTALFGSPQVAEGARQVAHRQQRG
jgi:ketosteroid isomerase-like protein